jgi:YggT family protein
MVRRGHPVKRLIEGVQPGVSGAWRLAKPRPRNYLPGNIQNRRELPAMPLIQTIYSILHTLLTLYMFAFIASAILSWLVAFNVINTNNQFVYTVGNFLYRITEPAVRPIRNIIPDLGGIDISPIFAILAIYLVRDGILPTVYQAVIG